MATNVILVVSKYNPVVFDPSRIGSIVIEDDVERFSCCGLFDGHNGWICLMRRSESL